jgi:hypothetical protein
MSIFYQLFGQIASWIIRFLLELWQIAMYYCLKDIVLARVLMLQDNDALSPDINSSTIYPCYLIIMDSAGSIFPIKKATLLLIACSVYNNHQQIPFSIQNREHFDLRKQNAFVPEYSRFWYQTAGGYPCYLSQVPAIVAFQSGQISIAKSRLVRILLDNQKLSGNLLDDIPSNIIKKTKTPLNPLL